MASLVLIKLLLLRFDARLSSKEDLTTMLLNLEMDGTRATATAGMRLEVRPSPLDLKGIYVVSRAEKPAACRHGRDVQVMVELVVRLLHSHSLSR